MFPDFERVALHHGVGVFAADASLSQGKQDPLGHHKPAELVHVGQHVVGIDDQLFDDAGKTVQGEVQCDGRIGTNGALNG